MVMQLCVSASLVFNQYVNPIAMDALDWKYYIVYTCWIAFEFGYLYWAVIETKGKNGQILPLEEIAALFDGEQTQEDINFAAAVAAGHTAGQQGPVSPNFDGHEAEKAGGLGYEKDVHQENASHLEEVKR